MKKKLLIVGLVLLLQFSIEGSRISLLGGITSSRLSITEDSYNSDIGWTVGLGTEFGRLIKKPRFQANVLFSYEKVNLGPASKEFRLLRFSLPLLFKYKLKPVRAPYFLAGGAGSIIFATDKSINENTTTTPLVEACFVLGAGIEMDFKRHGQYTGGSIVIEGRYKRGINKLKIKNFDYLDNSFYILIGFKFLGG